MATAMEAIHSFSVPNDTTCEGEKSNHRLRAWNKHNHYAIALLTPCLSMVSANPGHDYLVPLVHGDSNHASYF